jgi:hypothetical protein
MSVSRICPAYDAIVVGAGVAGLWTAGELARRHPGWTIAVVEKYKTFGGRLMSYAPKPMRPKGLRAGCESIPCSSPVHWEAGAGRIHASHRRVHALLKEHGLHAVPIGSALGYKASPESTVVENLFESVGTRIFLAPLTRLGPSVLGRHTLQELLEKVYSKDKVDWILNHYAYSSELRSMRADVALNSFLGKGSLGTHEGYSVVAEGFSELVQRMIAALPSDRVVILGRHTLTDVRPAERGATDCVFQYKDLKTIVLRARRACVLALHSDALKAVAPFQSWGPLRHLKMEPLLRIYMIFDVNKGGPWFKGLGRVVFPSDPRGRISGLRYMIPIDESKGTIMISYTDGTDTVHYRKLVEKYGDESRELADAVMGDVRRWWPELRVPSPKYTKAHLWTMGCTYWQPLGAKEAYVSADELMARTHRPYPRSLPGVYVAGESYSAGNQCWVEGALETAEAVVKMIG